MIQDSRAVLLMQLANVSTDIWGCKSVGMATWFLRRVIQVAQVSSSSMAKSWLSVWCPWYFGLGFKFKLLL